ncbi:MFS general substrate transporter [Penicillium argentinense]|uniref:MFS general substrate transporter n=1 Tax=Penicillium argentinense TaxID=1131581 RepID=A0A9W9FPZ4_9EURO|nr:MFS general substrate transporter [Penicillium argentinense]KAJ5104229.1 MFS general substrate transporter [Penicillium argentinense]
MYAGLVIGASVWPMTADFTGRRLTLNVTLLISAIGGMVGTGAPNFFSISLFCAVVALGTDGNQPVVSAIPPRTYAATHQYLLTMQSGFWSLGQAVAGLIAWTVPFKITLTGRILTGHTENDRHVTDVIQNIAERNGTTTWLTTDQSIPSQRVCKSLTPTSRGAHPHQQ